MFLKKLFKFGRDYRHYLEKADSCMAAEQYADARNAYLDALERLGDCADPSLPSNIRQKIAMAGDMLGRLNLVEAEHALAVGNRKKAEEHLQIIMDLAEDSNLRETAERMLSAPAAETAGAVPMEAIRGCVSCGVSANGADTDDHAEADDSISGEDRLTLHFQTLPGDLPERYAGMGEKFARGCMLNLQGDGAGALRVFEELSPDVENDILDYEKAILYFQRGEADSCERLLVKALGLNPGNPLCNIGLVQLYTETGRESEALEVLARMIASGVVPEQAMLMQGELYSLLGDEAHAIESYSKLLAAPQYAREAAVRIIPLLQGQGRDQEAAYLVKKFAKGCC